MSKHSGMAIVLMVWGVVALSGCNETKITLDDAALRARVAEREAVALAPLRTKHAGHTAAQALGGGAVGGVLGYIVVASIDSNLSTVPALDRDAAQQVTERLQAALSVRAHAPQPELIKALAKGDPKPQDVAAFAKDADAKNILTVALYFTHRDDLDNRVAVKGKWKLYDSSGVLKLAAETWLYSPNKSALLPNTRDPKYHKDYVDLTRQSADLFVQLIREGQVDRKQKEGARTLDATAAK